MIAGQMYERYEIVRLLGRGAMGEVYLATDTSTGLQVALKIVYGGPEREDEEVLEAERLGAELQMRLSGVDDRVVRVNRYGVEGSDLFIEMEYVPGEDLSALLARGPLPPGRAGVIAADLAEMLHRLSEFETTIGDKQFEGVVHGDLKPRNVRITPEGAVKVIDFGIAKALSHTRKMTMNLFASAAYCSPERLDTQAMDARSDLWSLGVMLYQMISGRLPFDEPSRERLERRILSGSPPEAMPESCPEPLRDIIFQMLAREPEDRYPNAWEVKEDLERFLRGDEVQAQPYVWDADATVRTGRGNNGDGEETAASYEHDDEGTVRTSALMEPLLPASSRHSALRRLYWYGGLALGLALFLLLFVRPQLQAWNEAGRLSREIETEQLRDFDKAWERYAVIARDLKIPLGLWRVRRALRDRLTAKADETLLEYRESENPTVREAQWKEAHTLYARALEIDSGNDKVKGKMRLCEAQLDRINAKGTTRLKRLNSAELKFRQAAQLLGKSPDPYIGLGVLYGYELNDMERAEEAFQKAEDYGRERGNRAKSLLADGYRKRGERIWRDSRAFSQVPEQERDYLGQARDDLQRAANLYAEVGFFGDAPQARMQCLLAIDKIDQRMYQLDHRTTEERQTGAQ